MALDYASHICTVHAQSSYNYIHVHYMYVIKTCVYIANDYLVDSNYVDHLGLLYTAAILLL